MTSSYYPPPWQDISTLCANVCASQRTIDAWVRQGLLPPPRMVGGKRLWKWADVEAYLEGRAGANRTPDEEAERIRHATRQAAAENRKNL